MPDETPPAVSVRSHVLVQFSEHGRTETTAPRSLRANLLADDRSRALPASELGVAGASVAAPASLPLPSSSAEGCWSSGPAAFPSGVPTDMFLLASCFRATAARPPNGIETFDPDPALPSWPFSSPSPPVAPLPPPGVLPMPSAAPPSSSEATPRLRFDPVSLSISDPNPVAAPVRRALAFAAMRLAMATARSLNRPDLVSAWPSSGSPNPELSLTALLVV